MEREEIGKKVKNCLERINKHATEEDIALGVEIRHKQMRPAQAAKYLAKEFISRNPPKEVNKPNQKTSLVSDLSFWEGTLRPQNNTWLALDKNLKTATKICIDVTNQPYEFWDRARYILLCVQGDATKRNVKRAERNTTRKSNHNIIPEIEGQEICRICWRIAIKRTGQNNRKLFCHMHEVRNKEERSKRYAIRKRLYEKDHENDSLYPLHGNLFFFQYSKDNFEHTINTYLQGKISLPHEFTGDIIISFWNNVWKQQPSLFLETLPCVKKYLIRKNASINSCRDIIETLDGPAPKIEPNDASSFRTQLYDYAERNLSVYLEHFLWAEMWLRGEDRPDL